MAASGLKPAAALGDVGVTERGAWRDEMSERLGQPPSIESFYVDAIE